MTTLDKRLRFLLVARVEEVQALMTLHLRLVHFVQVNRGLFWHFTVCKSNSCSIVYALNPILSSCLTLALFARAQAFSHSTLVP